MLVTSCEPRLALRYERVVTDEPLGAASSPDHPERSGRDLGADTLAGTPGEGLVHGEPRNGSRL